MEFIAIHSKAHRGELNVYSKGPVKGLADVLVGHNSVRVQELCITSSTGFANLHTDDVMNFWR